MREGQVMPLMVRRSTLVEPSQRSGSGVQRLVDLEENPLIHGQDSMGERTIDNHGEVRAIKKEKEASIEQPGWRN